MDCRELARAKWVSPHAYNFLLEDLILCYACGASLLAVAITTLIRAPIYATAAAKDQTVKRNEPPVAYLSLRECIRL